MPISLAAGPDPWWVADCEATATAEQRALGRVELELKIGTPVAGDHVVMSAGALRFRAKAGTPRGRIQGRLMVDAHPTDESVSAQEVMIRGVVERVELVPLRFRRDGQAKTFVPVEQLQAIAVESTLARDVVRSDLTVDATEHVGVELLVWLEVADGG